MHLISKCMIEGEAKQVAKKLARMCNSVHYYRLGLKLKESFPLWWRPGQSWEDMYLMLGRMKVLPQSAFQHNKTERSSLWLRERRGQGPTPSSQMMMTHTSLRTKQIQYTELPVALNHVWWILITLFSASIDTWWCGTCIIVGMGAAGLPSTITAITT